MIDPANAPARVVKRAPCEQCGARTERQAETLCKATQGIDGDYHCAGEFDDRGWSVQETAKSLQAYDSWIDKQRRLSPAETE